MVYIKIVNPGEAEEPVEINLNGITSVKSKATVEVLSADPSATNSMQDPVKVVPVESKLSDIKPSFTYKVPAHSIVVLKIKTS